MYLCTAFSKSNHGGLAHLARARHWQCRGDRFESGNLHQAKELFEVPFSVWQHAYLLSVIFI